MKILCILPFAASLAFAAADRVTAPVDPSRTVVVKGHVHPRVLTAPDMGPAAPATELRYMTLLLKPAPGLEPFLDAQQNAASPEYHRWLTPEQFGNRFGAGAGDMSKVIAWLQSQGLKVNDVARGLHWVTFSGTADQTGRALHTRFHKYQIAGKTHYANIDEPSIPEALVPVIAGFDGLNDFGLDSMIEMPNFTAGTSHYLAPDDIAAIYNTSELYNAGFDGTGQKLVVVGRTAVDLADIRAFRQKYNLPVKDPQVVLFGNDPGVSSSDQVEADLDLEWSGAVARNATIIYVYSSSVNTSAQYAIDQNLAPVISMSYGGCELETSPALRSIAQQANAQGITWAVSSGDSGAASCDRNSPTPQATKGTTVNFPASLPEITAVGGTQFNEGAGSYWNSANGANGGSAQGYIPEAAWNNSAARNQLSSSGGGASGYFPKPAWQTGPGVPNDGARDIPDLSFSASPDHDGYEVVYSGNSGIVGGTSASTPVFAGMLALVNQYLVSKGQAQAGLGNVNPTLYRLAQSTSGVFHDVIVGSNAVPCAQSSPDCVAGMAGFAAGPGYDLATGLGSVNAYNLATEWNKGGLTTLRLAAPATAAFGDTVQLTATVTGSGASGTPSGVVTFLTHDLSLGTAAIGSGGVAAIGASAAMIAGGNGLVSAIFGGDGVFAGSSAVATVKVALPGVGSAVVATINTNPVYEASGLWPYSITLTNQSAVATTLTAFTVDGVAQNLSFFTSTKIPANGSVSVSLAGNIVPPVNRVFHFGGMDADGAMWTQDFTVPFIAPLVPSLAATLALTSTVSSVQQNPQAPAACQWSHQLVVEERGGFSVQLAGLTAGTTDLSATLPQLFGTTRLAPFGKLEATICWGGLTAGTSKTYTILGVSEIGGIVSATAAVAFAAASASPAVFSVSPQTVKLSTPGASQNASAAIALNFGAAAPAWTAVVLPKNRSSSWLTLAAASGSGPGQVNVQANAAGLSPGVYQAYVSVQAADSVPQAITVPVVLVVGASTSTVIGGVANAASFGTTAAPGMILSVFGSQLASATASARGLPLPLTASGVSATVNGITAPLYFTAAGQLNVQVPYETGLGPAVMGVNFNGQIASFPFTVAAAAPGIFADASGALVPAGTGQQGQIVLAFITGEGDVTPSLATGATPASTTALSKLPAPRQALMVTVAGVPATIQFAGIPSGLAGATQINFTIPKSVPAGVQPVVVTVGGVASPAVKLMVTAAAQ